MRLHLWRAAGAIASLCATFGCVEGPGALPVSLETACTRRPYHCWNLVNRSDRSIAILVSRVESWQDFRPHAICERVNSLGQWQVLDSGLDPTVTTRLVAPGQDFPLEVCRHLLDSPGRYRIRVPYRMMDGGGEETPDREIAAEFQLDGLTPVERAMLLDRMKEPEILECFGSLDDEYRDGAGWEHWPALLDVVDTLYRDDVMQAFAVTQDPLLIGHLVAAQSRSELEWALPAASALAVSAADEVVAGQAAQRLATIMLERRSTDSAAHAIGILRQVPDRWPHGVADDLIRALEQPRSAIEYLALGTALEAAGVERLGQDRARRAITALRAVSGQLDQDAADQLQEHAESLELTLQYYGNGGTRGYVPDVVPGFLTPACAALHETLAPLLRFREGTPLELRDLRVYVEPFEASDDPAAR